LLLAPRNRNRRKVLEPARQTRTHLVNGRVEPVTLRRLVPQREDLDEHLPLLQLRERSLLDLERVGLDVPDGRVGVDDHAGGLGDGCGHGDGAEWVRVGDLWRRNVLWCGAMQQWDV
jgi:hypothetical protein